MEQYIIQDQDLATADGVARVLHKKGIDVNELSKCVGFLRDLARDKRDGVLFFNYLDTVIAEGRAVVRSRRTLDYYRAIRDACRQHLIPYQDNPQAMAQILGWAARLMRYYAVEDELGRKAKPPRAAHRQQSPRPIASGGRHTGTVKWFNADKRFGFIKPDGGGDDLFVHISETPEKRGLQEDQRISFSTEIGPKGPRACNVQVE